MNSLILKVCKITYENGITQTKNLISHDTYINLIKPKLIEIADLENELSKANKSKIKEIKFKIKELKNSITIKDYFTTESPLGKALHSGILKLPLQQGGNHKIKINYE